MRNISKLSKYDRKKKCSYLSEEIHDTCNRSCTIATNIDTNRIRYDSVERKNKITGNKTYYHNCIACAYCIHEKGYSQCSQSKCANKLSPKLHPSIFD